MLYSQTKLSIPEQINTDTDFTDIFGGILLDRLRKKGDNYFFHSHLFPYAVDFFKKRTEKGTSPVKILEKSLQGIGPFIPGGSILSTPISAIYKFRNFRFLEDLVREVPSGKLFDLLLKEQGVDELLESSMNQDWIINLLNEKMRRDFDFTHLFSIVNSGDESSFVSLNHGNFERGFAQVLTGGLEASIQMGYEDVLRIPSFNSRSPNFLNELEMDYIGEGLKRGTLVVEDKAGELLGKHSTGGTIVAKKGAGKYTGDCSRNVTFYIGEDVDSISQTRDCNWFIKGWVNEKINGVNSHFNIAMALRPQMRHLYFSDEYHELVKKKKEEIIQKLQKENCTFTEMSKETAKKYGEFVKSLEKAAA